MFSTKLCSFCAKDVNAGKGVKFVRNDCTILLFCSSKCRKNSLQLKRDPRKFKWTKNFKKNN